MEEIKVEQAPTAVKPKKESTSQQVRLDKTVLLMLYQLKGYKETYSDVIRRALITAKMDTLRHDLTAKKQDELEKEIEETKALRENIEEVEGES